MNSISSIPQVRCEVDDPVATITLNRPETLNALTTEMIVEMRRLVDVLTRDRAVVGIVITGEGRGFCSGLDASALMETVAQGPSARPDVDLPGMFTWLLEVPKPVIAAVNGVAAAGGFVLSAMCDIRIASTAGSFTSVFAKRGLVAEHGTTWILPRLIGTGAALDLLWSSRRVGATEARRLGLVHQVVEPGDLLATARQYVLGLAENVSPSSLADTKALVYRDLGRDYRSALLEVDEVQYAALDRADAREGVEALLEKRAPRFLRLGETGP